MSRHDHLIAEGVLVDLEGFPTVFVEASNCTASQINSMEHMCESHSNGAFHFSSHGNAREKGRAVVSKQSVSVQCATGPVMKSGFVFRLFHLKSYGQQLFLMHIRDLKGLPLEETKFTFTFDSVGVMQGWTRVQKDTSVSRIKPKIHGTQGR